MDPLNPMASTLDPAMAQIYAQASSIRENLRKDVPSPDPEQIKENEEASRRRRRRQVVREVLATPERLRGLVAEGRFEDAKREWEMPRRMLERWKQQEVGGDDVDLCLRDGDAALRSTDEESESSSARESKDDGR
jgi:vacuolar protein sorting-associated protein 51